MIETKTKPKTQSKKSIAKTEEDLQTKFGKSNDPVIKALLTARIEHLQKHGRYFTDDEVQIYLDRK